MGLGESCGLDFLEAVEELTPVVHDSDGAALLGKHLGHSVHLRLVLIRADIAYERNLGVLGGGSARPAVLDGDALAGLDTNLLAGVEVNGWVGFRGWLLQRGGGAVNVLGGEEFGLADLADGSLNAGQSG